MELSEEELEALTLAFHMYDLDGSGAIDTYELKKALESMGQNPSDQDVLELMAAMDEDNSGTISFIEFMNMVKFQKQLGTDLYSIHKPFIFVTSFVIYSHCVLLGSSPHPPLMLATHMCSP